MNDRSTPGSPTTDLARLRARKPAWHIRHAGEDHPGQLGYLASREGILLTAENLIRLADRIDEADRCGPPPALMVGPAGWLSGPMGPVTIADVIHAYGDAGWQISAQPGGRLVAEYRTGTMLRVLAAHSPAELAARISDAISAMPPADTGTQLAELAAAHPTWAVDVAQHGHGVEATRGTVRLWAHCAAELAALLDVADRARDER